MYHFTKLFPQRDTPSGAFGCFSWIQQRASRRSSLGWRQYSRPVISLRGIWDKSERWHRLVGRVCNFGGIWNARFTWSPHIDQVIKWTAQRMGMLGPLLNRKSDLSVRNGVLLYKQLIHPLMDYGCHAWRSANRTHVRRLQVLQSKCLCLATCTPWYVSSRQIHEELCSAFCRPSRSPDCEIWLKVSWCWETP